MMDEKDEIIQLLEFDVSGMSCDRCAMWVTEAIKKNVENVVDVRVKSVKTTERNVCVSLKLLSSSSQICPSFVHSTIDTHKNSHQFPHRAF